MSNEKQETVAGIVAEMRQDIANGTVGIWSDFGGEIARSYADRIEAAANHQFREVAKMIPHEEVAVSKMETPTIKFFKLDERAKIPTRAHPTDSGMDICALEDVWIVTGKVANIRTGICAVIPKGYELQVRPRSGMSRNGMWVAFGTVDEGYRGEIKVTIANVYVSDFGMDKYHIHTGDRIAQLVLVPVVRPTIEECEKPTEQTDRGESGFGSTVK